MTTTSVSDPHHPSTRKRVTFDSAPNQNIATDDFIVVADLNRNGDVGDIDSDRWISNAEINAWRKANVEELRICKKNGNKFHDTTDFSPRGYEYVTMNYSRVAVRNKHAQRVVKFQQIARSATALARFATIDTTRSGSMTRALTLATNDENEALLIQHPHLYQQENCPPSKLLYPNLSSSPSTPKAKQAAKSRAKSTKTHQTPLFHMQIMKVGE